MQGGFPKVIHSSAVHVFDSTTIYSLAEGVYLFHKRDMVEAENDGENTLFVFIWEKNLFKYINNIQRHWSNVEDIGKCRVF